MKQTLILPDVHNHTAAAEEVISRLAPDAVVFLGDYFDSMGDTPADAARTAQWLKKSLATPGRTHLWGNHDLPYAFPKSPEARCPGFTPEKCQAVQRILTPADWAQLQVLHFLRPDLCCSHAGLNESFQHPILGQKASARCQKALDDLRAGLPSLLTTEEGPLWLRWWHLPLHEELSQVVGHTVGELRVKQYFYQPGAKFNACIDTFGEFVGWLEGTHFSIRRAVDGSIEWEEER